MLVIKQEIAEIRKGLEAWDWIDFSGKEPFLTTWFGDVFFKGDGGIWFLDTLEGSLTRMADSEVEMLEILDSEQGQDHFLLAGLVLAAKERKMIPGKGECLDFGISPVLGGEMSADNLTVMSVALSLNLAGQIMKQVRDWPEGAMVDEVRLEGE